MESLEECIVYITAERSLSKASVSNYKCILTQACTLALSAMQTKSFVLDWPLIAWDIIKIWIKDKTVNTKKNWYIALSAYIHTCITEESKKYYTNIILDLQHEVEQTCIQSKIKAKEQKFGVSSPQKWVELCRLADVLWTQSTFDLQSKQQDAVAIDSNELISIQNALICSLFTLIPPRRSLDYAEMIIVKNTDEACETLDNCIIVDVDGVPTFFSFRKYKTSKTYGQQIIPIPENITVRVRIWVSLSTQLQAYSCGPQYFLLSPRSMQRQRIQPITAQSIGAILRNNLGTGIRDIRKSKITHVFYNDTSTMLKQDLAAKMGHSTETQQQVYRNESHKTCL